MRGCKLAIALVLSLLFVTGLVAVLLFLLWPGEDAPMEREKVIRLLGGFGEVGQLNQQNRQRNPFKVPREAVISATDLDRFLSIREQVVALVDDEPTYGIFVAQMLADEPDPSEECLRWVAEVKLALAKLLLSEHMSPEQYVYCTMLVYITWLEGAKNPFDKLPQVSPDNEVRTDRPHSMPEQIAQLHLEAYQFFSDAEMLFRNELPEESLALLEQRRKRIEATAIHPTLEAYLLMGTYRRLVRR